MERLDVVVKRVDGDKALQKIEVKPEREVSITDAGMDVQRDIYFYFLDQIQLIPANNADKEFSQQFNAAMKDALRKEYIELFNIQKKFIAPFINSGLIMQITYLQGALNVSMEQAQQLALAQFQMIFVCAYGPDQLSIKKLKVEIESLARMSDEQFGEKLSDFDIMFLAKSAYIKFKNNIVQAYQQYFQKAEEHLAYAKRAMPHLTMDDFDLYRNQIAEQMKSNPQRAQERTVLEFMRMYASYPQYQEHVLPLILDQAKPQPIIKGEKEFQIGRHVVKLPLISGMTLPIQLPPIAHELEREGLQPSHIQSVLLITNVPVSVVPQNTDQESKSRATVVEIDEEGEKVGNVLEGKSKPKDTKKKEITEMILQPPQQGQLIVAPPTEAQQRSFASTVKLFLVSDEILREFKDLPSSPQYQDKNEKLTAFQKVENILLNAKNVTDYEAAFKLMAPYINRHKNLLADMIFGNKNTDTWKKVMKQIREPAMAALIREVNFMADTDARIKRLKEACEMPLFNEHRNNHWYTGAIGDTHAVSVIKKEIVIFEAQRRSELSFK
jgi:hypothetical protein